MKINVILAHCSCYGIGYRGKMCWRVGADLKLFAKLTTGDGDYKNAIIMGRKTWESLPGKRPLMARDNLILSRLPVVDANDSHNSHVAWFSNIDAVLARCTINQYNEVWIIGGEQIYSAFMGADAPYRSLVHTVHITRIDADFRCDAFCSEDAVSESAMQKYFTPVSKRYSVEKCVILSLDSDTPPPPPTNLNVIFCEYVNNIYT